MISSGNYTGANYTIKLTILGFNPKSPKTNEIGGVNKFENRYLLMVKTKNVEQFVVAVFNDININKYRRDYTLPVMAKGDGKQLLLDAVAEVLECVDTWHKLRGNEFLLDTRHFRTARKSR